MIRIIFCLILAVGAVAQLCCAHAGSVEACQLYARDYAAMLAPLTGGALLNTARNGFVLSSSGRPSSQGLTSAQTSGGWRVGQQAIDQQPAYQNAYGQAYQSCRAAAP